MRKLQEKSIFVPSGNLKIPRRNMPQIEGGDYSEFVRFLKKNGVTMRTKTEDISKLKPTQKEISTKAVERLMSTNSPKLERPLLVSKDGYILDGHHRWLALLNIENSNTHTVREINLQVRQALHILREFPKAIYKDTSNKVFTTPNPKLRLEGKDMTDPAEVINYIRESFSDIDAACLDASSFDIILDDILSEMTSPKDSTEYKNKSFRDFISEAKKPKYNPDDRVPVRGFGTVKVKDLERMTENRLKEVDKFRKRGDWRNVLHQLKNTAIMPMLEVLKDIQDAQDD